MTDRSRASILIVEDENVVAMDIESSLQRLGYDVVGIAARGEDAVELARRTRPDLVLMDIRLRGEMDGIRAAEMIQESASVPVVYLTAYSHDATFNRARSSHPFGYVIKPFEERELEMAIRMALYRHETEHALRTAEARARSILETAQDAIIIADVKGRVTEWNKAAQAMFAYTAREAKGRPLTFLMPERYHEPHRRGLDRYLSTGNPHVIGRTVEMEGRRRSGEEFPLEVSLSAWGTGDDTFFTGIIRDISERRRVRGILQQELETKRLDLEGLALDLAQSKRELKTALESMRAAKEQAERASEVKTTFLSMVSHELRTPLASLQLQIERLQIEGSAEVSRENRVLLERMAASTKRLHDLLERVLQYTRMESGRLSVESEAIDVKALGWDVIEELRPRAAAKNVSLEVDCRETLPPLRSDSRLVRLILINLLGNAVKFTEQGQVTLSVDFADGLHRFAVSDTGPGISPEQQVRIFEPFEQLEPVRSKYLAGVGLGLALVREMVRSLRGYVGLTSQVGVGSTFTVELPQLESPEERR